MKEIWKNIKGYENLYEVSNYGNVRSLDHYRNNNNGIAFQKGKILKPGIQNTGYASVVLSKEGKTKCYKVHRLVAETFIPNTNNYKCVNHKDENKLNNMVENLEWCNHEYNNNYGTKQERYKKSMRKSVGRKVNQYDLEGNFIKKWNCFAEIEEYLNKKRAGTPIWMCCNKKIKTAYGYKWEYAD